MTRCRVDVDVDQIKELAKTNSMVGVSKITGISRDVLKYRAKEFNIKFNKIPVSVLRKQNNINNNYLANKFDVKFYDKSNFKNNKNLNNKNLKIQDDLLQKLKEIEDLQAKQDKDITYLSKKGRSPFDIVDETESELDQENNLQLSKCEDKINYFVKNKKVNIPDKYIISLKNHIDNLDKDLAKTKKLLIFKDKNIKSMKNLYNFIK